MVLGCKRIEVFVCSEAKLCSSDYLFISIQQYERPCNITARMPDTRETIIGDLNVFNLHIYCLAENFTTCKYLTILSSDAHEGFQKTYLVTKARNLEPKLG